jgi:hypothetical protein
MTMDNISKLVDLLMKFEAHAFVLLGLGVILVLKGHQQEGTLILGGALGIFRGTK